MEIRSLSNPVVREVILALRDGNQRAFSGAFAPSAKLTDDGQPQPLAEWAEREIFRSHGRLDVESERRDGLELVGRFHSDQWDMKTVWRFEIVNGRVTRLDVAAL